MQTPNTSRHQYRQPPLRVAVRGVRQEVPSETKESTVPKVHTVKVIQGSIDGVIASVVPRPTPAKLPSVSQVTKKPTLSEPKLAAKPAATEVIRKQSAAEEQKGKKSSKTRRKAHTFYAMAAAVIVVGVGMIVQSVVLNGQVSTQVSALRNDDETASATSSSSNSLPTSEKPSDPNYIDNYHVASGLPRTIKIPSINVYARTLQVGVDRNNTMLTPSTAYDTAWYSGSSKPGEMGAMIVNAHVLSENGLAIFTNLHKLVAGAEIVIESGSGEKYTYSVVDVLEVPTDQVDMGKMLVSADTSKPGLSLITCAGKYNAKENTFGSRTLVRAVMN